jgi:hypothetical protein
MSVQELTRQQILGIRLAFAHLMPGCDVSAEVMDRSSFSRARLPDQRDGPQAGRNLGRYEATLWAALPTGRIGVFTVRRELVPFSEAEEELLACFAETMRAIPFVADEQQSHRAELIANSHAFERMLATQYLQGVPQSGTAFWTPDYIVSQLQDLAFKRYEGQPSMSGFLIVAHPDAYVQRKIEPSCYDFDPFPEPFSVQEQFFEHPASYRYVDGRTAFYLIDRTLQVRGLVRCTDPARYSQTARAAHEHLEPLLEADATKAWAGYIGENDDVNIVVTPHKHLRWLNAHWHFVDQYHLFHALERHGVASTEIDDLVAVLLAISDMRRGTLILIPDDEEHLPPTAGYIDNSKIGRTLYQLLQGQLISTLRTRQAAVGMLTSDGLTTIARSGCVLNCGEIVHMGEADNTLRQAGGGRTQAAIAASHYGLVVKISEDGPISFYKDGREQISIVF